MSSINRNNKFIRYLKNPLIGVSATTAYRMPNSMIHFPVIFMISYLGVLICGTHARPLLPLYFIIALYAGRDMVIMSYKNYFIPAGIWILFAFFIYFKKELSGTLSFDSLRLSFAFTAVLFIVFIVYVKLVIK